MIILEVKTYRKFNHKSIHYATNNRDKIESIPSVFEVTLNVERDSRN